MGQETAIGWCDHTFNPWWGCVNISPACDNCYAERDAKRYGHPIWGKDAPRRFFGDKYWAQPLKWDRLAEEDGIRRRVFCASMADVMEDRRDLDEWRVKLWELIRRTPHLDWLLLTKRPQNFRRLYPSNWQEVAQPNVWLGTTVESPQYLWRIGELTTVAATIHFLSIEPLIEPIPELRLWVDHIEWIIAGGESGPRARAMGVNELRQIRDAAQSRKIPFYFKQWGEYGPFHSGPISELGRGPLETGGGHRLVEINSYTMARFGKKAAGASLDGREWKEFPHA